MAAIASISARCVAHRRRERRRESARPGPRRKAAGRRGRSRATSNGLVISSSACRSGRGRRSGGWRTPCRRRPCSRLHATRPRCCTPRPSPGRRRSLSLRSIDLGVVGVDRVLAGAVERRRLAPRAPCRCASISALSASTSAFVFSAASVVLGRSLSFCVEAVAQLLRREDRVFGAAAAARRPSCRRRARRGASKRQQDERRQRCGTTRPRRRMRCSHGQRRTSQRSRHDDATTGSRIVTNSSAAVGWMPSVASKMRLGRARLHRHREALDRLAGVGADHVQADDAVVGVVDDELHQRALAAARQRVAQRPEVGAVDADLARSGRARRLPRGRSCRCSDG